MLPLRSWDQPRSVRMLCEHVARREPGDRDAATRQTGRRCRDGPDRDAQREPARLPVRAQRPPVRGRLRRDPPGRALRLPALRHLGDPAARQRPALPPGVRGRLARRPRRCPARVQGQHHAGDAPHPERRGRGGRHLLAPGARRRPGHRGGPRAGVGQRRRKEPGAPPGLRGRRGADHRGGRARDRPHPGGRGRAGRHRPCPLPGQAHGPEALAAHRLQPAHGAHRSRHPGLQVGDPTRVPRRDGAAGLRHAQRRARRTPPARRTAPPRPLVLEGPHEPLRPAHR